MEKCFQPEAVEWMSEATYDAMTEEVTLPMDAHIWKIDEGDIEVHLANDEVQQELTLDDKKANEAEHPKPKVLKNLT